MGFGDSGAQSRPPNPESRLADLVRDREPLTVAAFMELALYDPVYGYYARSARRSGRAGDFFTSVDVGPVFGELLAIQLAEMFHILQTSHFRLLTSDFRLLTSDFRLPTSDFRLLTSDFDLVEAGAGNGRLSADILRTLRERDPNIYSRLRLHLIETSAAAREAQSSTLGDVRERFCSATTTLPESFEGVLVANELLDAMPVHQVVMREEGLREVYIVGSARATADAPKREGEHGRDRGLEKAALRTIEGPLSTPALQEYIDRLGVALEPGWRVEINLRALDWIRDAARRLRRGFIILIDYGHEARELYSASHAHGTLTTFSQHQSGGSQEFSPPWLDHPGEQDITAHVDFTSIRDTAESEGLTPVGFLDQTYFVLGLVRKWDPAALSARAAALKTLMMPGGLGSTHKVMILGKGVGTPSLSGCSFGTRVT